MDDQVDDTDNMLALLREYDVVLSSQVQLILKKLKFTSIKSIAEIEADKLCDLEKDVRDYFATDTRLSTMNQDEKLALFGEYYADDPKSFKFLPGERCALRSAIVTAKKLADAYAANYVYEKCDSVKQVRQKRKQKAKSSRCLDNNATQNSSTSSGSNTDIVRKRKTLHQYLVNWRSVTKHKLNFLASDWEIKDRGNSVVCKKCNNRPFTVTADSHGGWKASSFINHLISAHVVPENELASQNTQNTNAANASSRIHENGRGNSRENTCPPEQNIQDPNQASQELAQDIQSVVNEGEPPEKGQRLLDISDF